MLFLFSILACSEKEITEDVETRAWLSAELAPLSSDACPDMSQSGELVSFLSSDEERNVNIIFPEVETENMRVLFFFHGLMPEGSDPASQTASALDLQGFADEYETVIILPESPVWDLMGQKFHLWDIEEGTHQNDLALYDDLRTCVANEFSVDLDKLVSTGFSGGSLFNTVLLSNRSDTLAAVVEMSGGADLQVPLFEGTFAPYQTPSTDIPILLVSGGDSDIWPDASFTLVDFNDATDTLQENLLADEQFVVRCRHNSGHTITLKAFSTAVDWILNHEFGEASPYEADIGSWEDWCEIP